MGLFGFGSSTCGHRSSSPFRTSCTKDRGHSGKHRARGMTWGEDGKIAFGGSKRPASRPGASSATRSGSTTTRKPGKK